MRMVYLSQADDKFKEYFESLNIVYQHKLLLKRQALFTLGRKLWRLNIYLGFETQLIVLLHIEVSFKLHL